VTLPRVDDKGMSLRATLAGLGRLPLGIRSSELNTPRKALTEIKVRSSRQELLLKALTESRLRSSGQKCPLRTLKEGRLCCSGQECLFRALKEGSRCSGQGEMAGDQGQGSTVKVSFNGSIQDVEMEVELGLEVRSQSSICSPSEVKGALCSAPQALPPIQSLNAHAGWSLGPVVLYGQQGFYSSLLNLASLLSQMFQIQLFSLTGVSPELQRVSQATLV